MYTFEYVGYVSPESPDFSMGHKLIKYTYLRMNIQNIQR